MIKITIENKEQNYFTKKMHKEKCQRNKKNYTLLSYTQKGHAMKQPSEIKI